MMDFKKWTLTDKRKEVIKKRLTSELKNLGLKYNSFMNSTLLDILSDEVKVALNQINNTYEEEKPVPQFPELTPKQIMKKNAGVSVMNNGNGVSCKRKE